MIEKFQFYAKHSFNDLRVNGQRTLFALLCIAAGVAAIVSLQTLGVMIENTLTGSLQEANQGDIRISADIEDFDISDEEASQVGEDGLITIAQGFGGDRFGEAGLATLDAWFEDNFSGAVDTITTQQALSFGSGASLQRTERSAPLAIPIMVDASTFPLYGTVELLDGQGLDAVLNTPSSIAINEKLADTLQAEIGDVISIGGATENFTLMGIVSDSSSGLGDDAIGGALIGTYFLDQSALEFFPNVEPGASEVYVRLNDPSRVGAIGEALVAEYPYLSVQTTDDLLEQNEQIASGIYDLVSAMGLLSMLIGGIGIINTMQVIVRRRTVEVAVLKTLGLQGGQVTVLFLVEAFLMGLIGSVLGIVSGLLLTLFIRGAAESVTGPLPFTVAPGPILTGLIVGVLVTTVFGFLPTLSAGKVRPGLVLRPRDELVPRAGILQSLLALLVVVVAVTIIGAGFIGLVAAAIVPAAFIAMGVMYLVLSLVVWLVGRFFPSFGSVDLKVSLRSMLAARSRVASTLLALVIGVFVLSVITLLTGTVLRQFQEIIELDTGGNVIVFGLASSDETFNQIDQVLADGQEAGSVLGYSALRQYAVNPLEITKADGTVVTYEQIIERVNELGTLDGFVSGGDGEGEQEGPSAGDLLQFSFGSMDSREVESGTLPELPFFDGRQLNADDIGTNAIILSRNNQNGNAFGAEGIEVGDEITFAFENNRLSFFGLNNPDAETVTFEIVGIIDRTSTAGVNINTSPMYVPTGAIPVDIAPTAVSAIAEVQEDSIADVQFALTEIPGVLVLETRLLNELINAVVEQFTSLPVLVATLSLIVGGIVIANSVALTTMERRREIAVMKSVGLQRERVLGMLLLENGLMGLIGGIIGVGLGVIILLALLGTIFPGIDTAGSVPYGTAGLLMLLCVGIAVGAAMLSAWGASGEKPLNVLRYE